MVRRSGSVAHTHGARKRAVFLEYCTASAFVLPALCVYVLFILTPLGRTVWNSFTNWSGMSAATTFRGVTNYQAIFRDPRFVNSIGRSVIFCALHMLLAGGGGLMLAVLISQMRRGLQFFRTVAFFPNVLSLAVVGVLWSQIYNPQNGLLNGLLRGVGLGGLQRAWLGERALALPAVSIASSWQAYGFYMIIFLAAIQGIDPELYEAGTIDGAGKWRQFVSITLPSMYNTLSVVATIALINGLKGFGTVWSMTQGGPYNQTELTVVYIWRMAFESLNLSKALAASVMFIAAVAVLTFVFNRIRDGRAAR